MLIVATKNPSNGKVTCLATAGSAQQAYNLRDTIAAALVDAYVGAANGQPPYMDTLITVENTLTTVSVGQEVQPTGALYSEVNRPA